MLVRSADEVAAVKSQAKAAAAKFSERARAEKSTLQAEIKQLQVKQCVFGRLGLLIFNSHLRDFL
jgi:gas vesicle protein